MKRRLAPSPPGAFLTGHLHGIRHDVLGMLLKATREHGDVVRFRVGPLTLHLINHPDLVSHILIKNRQNYDKESRSSANLGLICGESILTASGPAWQWRRRLIQPLFNHEAVTGFVQQIVACTEAMMRDWQDKARAGVTVDIASEMMRLTFRIVGRCLFGTDLTREAGTVEEAMHTIVAHTYARWRSIWSAPPTWPTPANRRFQKAMVEVDAIITRLMDDHRAHPPATPDLLTMLMGGRDAETGDPVSDLQVRREAITFLLAGHETTANALSWTFHLLGQHPDSSEAIRQEMRSICGDGSPTMADLPRFTETLHVFEESLRLFPPIWAMERNVRADDELGGWSIPGGSAVIISPYTLHRHPAFWENPESFQPDRFTKCDRSAYLPFGAGPRFCIGNEFALAEARVILPMVLRAFDLLPETGSPIEPEPAITLRLKNGLPMKLRARQA